MRGIVGYGTYVPYYRIEKSEIGIALGTQAGRGLRSVAAYDEDSTTMAVAAGRDLMTSGAASGELPVPASVYFASATPAYLDKTNANVVHAALRLPSSSFAVDMMGSSRSLTGAMAAAIDSSKPVLVVSADVRTGRPASSEEASGGDAGVAILYANDDEAPVLATCIGGASATSEFLDRWRLPGWNYSRVWEERFGEHVYLPLVTEAANAAMKENQIEPDDVDSVAITGLHARSVRGAARAAGVDSRPMGPELTSAIGNTGTPHSALSLAAALDVAGPNETIMVISLADGCDVSFYRTTEALATYRRRASLAEQIEGGKGRVGYNDFLTWRGFLDREPPRRPDPIGPAAPPSYRLNEWKYGFVGSRDRSSGAVHLPPQRVSVRGGAVDDMEPAPMADVEATVATFTIDHLAFSLAPPTVAVVIDFDGGGRFNCQLTDATPDSVAIGNRVAMTFRRLYTADGIHNYFWKATPTEDN